MSAVLRFRGSQQLGPALLPSPGEQAAASGSGAAAEVGARPAAAADGLDVNSRLPQAEQEGLPPLASFSRYFNQERVRIDKVMSCVLLVSWAAAVFRFVPRCPQLENWVSLLWASVLAASLAWAHFGPNSYARYREHLMAGLRITRWAYPCIARPTVYIGLSAAGAEGSGSGSCSGFLSCWHQGAAGPLAILLLVPVMQLQAALGYHVRLPWAAVVLAGELALTLPRQCALCADPLMQPGQQGGAVVHALHSTFSFLLGTGTAPGSGLSGGAGSRGSSAGNQCWAVVVMLELVLGFLLPLAVTSARERAAFSRFYRHHRGWVQCDSCCAVYLMSVAGDGNSVGGAAGSLDSGSPVQPAPSAGQARRWVRWAQIAACSFALLWVQWDIITELSALRQP